MCGIAGIWNWKGANGAMLLHLSKTLRHRGPDDEGFLLLVDAQLRLRSSDDTHPEMTGVELPYAPQRQLSPDETFQLGLVHRRLSIIDLSVNGHQPISDATGRYWLTYNGEIYNFLELRKRLEGLGHTFYSQTDSEVVLHAFMEWGQDCLELFDGMWALCVYDSKTGEIFMSRDRTGVKPLYYYHNNGGVVFASELKAIATLPNFKPTLNLKAAGDFLAHGLLERGGACLFEGVEELLPGHFLKASIHSNALQVGRYFDSATAFRNDQNKLEVAEVRVALLEAIQSRLMSDVKVGCCLSGGLDSSSIAGMIHHWLAKGQIEQVGSTLTTFTACSELPEYDERDWAKQVADSIDAKWLTVEPTAEELLGDMEDLVYTQDLPLLSTSTYAQYRVMKLVAGAGVKVVLDGQGGDELFAGYPHYYMGWVRDQIAHGRFSAISDLSGEHSIIPSMSYPIKTWMKSNLLPSMGTLAKPFQRKYHQEWRYLATGLLEVAPGLPMSGGGLNDQLLHDYFNGPLKSLLRCEDRNSMRFSVESRTPMADSWGLMKLLHSASSGQKMTHGQPKYLMRKAMQGLVPDKVLDRRDKMGYVTPNNRWVKQIAEHYRGLLLENDSGLFNREQLNKDFDLFFKSDQRQENFRVFKFISFAVWYNRFFKT